MLIDPNWLTMVVKRIVRVYRSLSGGDDVSVTRGRVDWSTFGAGVTQAKVSELNTVFVM
jgi:hypothetical protein